MKTEEKIFRQWKILWTIVAIGLTLISAVVVPSVFYRAFGFNIALTKKCSGCFIEGITITSRLSIIADVVAFGLSVLILFGILCIIIWGARRWILYGNVFWGE